MDFSLNDVALSDPFLSLDTDLDDVSEVIRKTNWSLEPYPNQMAPAAPAVHQQSSTQVSSNISVPHAGWNDAHVGSVEERLFQALPDQERAIEIESIMSHLQQGADTAPNCINEQQSFFVPIEDEHRLPEASFVGNEKKLTDCEEAMKWSSTGQSGSRSDAWTVKALLQRPRAADLQSILRRPPVMLSPSQTILCNSVKTEQPSQYREPSTSSSTKDELLKLLTSMTTYDVERLVRDKDEHNNVDKDKGKSPIIGVATKMTGGEEVTTEMASISSAVSDESDTTETDTGAVTGDILRGPLKTERRAAHNLIEKKYRCSINDRINQLKVMLAGDQAKLSKSAILRKAVDYIEQLRAENDQLRRALSLSRDCPLPVSPTHSSLDTSSSPVQSSNPSSPTIPERETCSPQAPSVKKKKRSFGSVSDRSRVTLLMLAVTLLAFNPFSLLLSSNAVRMDQNNINDQKQYSGEGSLGGRTLLASGVFDETENGYWPSVTDMARPVCMWALNGLLLIYLLARLLFYGDWSIDSDSIGWNRLCKQHAEAEEVLREGGRLREAARMLAQCLESVDRPMPYPGIGRALALFSQTLRHLLNVVCSGWWPWQRRRGCVKPWNEGKSHAELASIYHSLHQLHLLGVSPNRSSCSDNITGLILALSAVNQAQCAGSSIPSHTLIQIYIHAALCSRLSIPSIGGRLIQRYFLSRAKRLSGVGPLPKSCAWMFHPIGEQFISDRQCLISSFAFKSTSAFPFCTIQNNTDPFEHVTAALKIHLLTRLADRILSRREDTWSKRSSLEFMDISHLLLDMCQVNDTFAISQLPRARDHDDPLCFWWTQLLTCAFLWTNGDYVRAKQRYHIIRKCPPALLSQDLALAIGNAFCSRKLCIEDKSKKQYRQFVWIHCVKAQRALHQNNLKMTRNPPSQNELMTSLSILTYDMILGSILEIWIDQLDKNKQYWMQPAGEQLSQLYNANLVEFRLIHDRTDFKLLILEAGGRMLFGANPIRTWQMLLRCHRAIIVEQTRNDNGFANVDRRRLTSLLELHDSIARP